MKNRQIEMDKRRWTNKNGQKNKDKKHRQQMLDKKRLKDEDRQTKNDN